MSPRRSTYPFIALEGCDGVGKSTIRDELQRVVERLDLLCTLVGQHSWLDIPASRVINGVRDRTRRYSPEDIAAAYYVDKRLHAEHTITPATADAVVIADRYVLSDAVYQEVLYGIPAETTLDRHAAAGTRTPDLTIYVSVPVETAYLRVQKRSKEARHYERPAEMTQIMAGYERLIRGPDRLASFNVVEFVNDSPDWEARVRRELGPVFRSLLGVDEAADRRTVAATPTGSGHGS